VFTILRAVTFIARRDDILEFLARETIVKDMLFGDVEKSRTMYSGPAVLGSKYKILIGVLGCFEAIVY
jgi:hypothetical protein